jgi:hypothetical protein
MIWIEPAKKNNKEKVGMWYGNTEWQ